MLESCEHNLLVILQLITGVVIAAEGWEDIGSFCKTALMNYLYVRLKGSLVYGSITLMTRYGKTVSYYFDKSKKQGRFTWSDYRNSQSAYVCAVGD